MKRIHKSDEPTSFIRWKRRHPNAKWRNFQGSIKFQLKEALIAEQGHICCYCNKRIKLHISHIEHLQPRSKSRGLAFNYYNLLASCSGELDRNRNVLYWHCGHAKGNDELPISPKDVDCENYFGFDEFGEIFPHPELSGDDWSLAQYTINLLELNCAPLVRRRRESIDALDFDDEDYSDADLQKLIKVYQKRYENMFEPFCTAIVYVLKSRLMVKT